MEKRLEKTDCIDGNHGNNANKPEIGAEKAREINGVNNAADLRNEAQSTNAGYGFNGAEFVRGQTVKKKTSFSQIFLMVLLAFLCIGSFWIYTTQVHRDIIWEIYFFLIHPALIQAGAIFIYRFVKELQKKPIPKSNMAKPVELLTQYMAIFLLNFWAVFGFAYTINDIAHSYIAKPVVYLYPMQEERVKVELDYEGELKYTYPRYDGGWDVIAEPDGTLTNMADGREYSYLFWEGVSDIEYDMSSGYVVKGEDTAEFLQEKLAEIGLLPKEYNEFIVYWLPHMQDNPYNLITFQNEAYTDSAVLNVTPEPDSVLRVFMAFKALDEPIDVNAPTIEPFEREGFTVVEWGGTEVK